MHTQMLFSTNKRCVCSPYWTGEDCSTALCPFDCSGHGTCMDGVCECDAGWSDFACASKLCQGDCSGLHPLLIILILPLSWLLPRHSPLHTHASYLLPHAGLGRLRHRRAIVSRVLVGQRVCDCASPRTGHGTCTSSTGLCECQSGWEGEECHLRATCLPECAHGTCVSQMALGTNATCVCDAGTSCQQMSADDVCAEWLNTLF